MSLDTNALREAMIAAARDAVRERWPHIQAIADEQFGILAASLESVARLAASGVIDESRAASMRTSIRSPRARSWRRRRASAR